MQVTREALVTFALRLAAPLFLVLAAVGGARYYSIVPFWDMWPAYVDFYTRVTEGDWSQWWALHMEHRLVLSRVLFWIDMAWFRGTVVFLIVVNYLLVGGIFLTFRSILRERTGVLADTRPVALTVLFIFVWLFSWVQRHNFIWGFQSQFLLAQWVPLLAFYLLYKSTLPSPAAQRRFVLACTAGVLSIGTMANGVIALPIMVVYAVLQNMGWKRIGALALLSVVCITAYFTDYRTPGVHGEFGRGVPENPLNLARYVLLYLGAPFFHILGRSLLVGQAFGLAFVLLALVKAAECLRAPRRHGLEIVLLAFILYIGGTALGTALGRLGFGLEHAVVSRYSTPALMAWVALLILFLPSLLRRFAAWQARVVLPLLLLLAALLNHQVTAARSVRAELFEMEVAGLALELGIDDDQQLRRIVDDPEAAMRISRKPAQANLSVFGLPSIRDAAQLLNRPAGALSPASCEGALTERTTIEDAPAYLRIRGWIAPPAGGKPASAVRLVTAGGVVVGYALAAEPVSETAAAGREGARSQKFSGYVLSGFVGDVAALAPVGADCTARVRQNGPS